MKTQRSSRRDLQVALASQIQESSSRLLALLAARGRRPRDGRLVNIQKAMDALGPDPEVRAAFAACSALCWRLAETGRAWAVGWALQRRDWLAAVGLEQGDVVSTLLMGLHNAAWQWNPARSTQFLTFADKHARVRMQRAIQGAKQPVHVPTHALTTLARAEAMANYGMRPPEIRGALGRAARTVELARPTITWLDAPTVLRAGERSVLGHDLVADPGPGPEALVAEAEADQVQSEAVAAALVGGDPRITGVLDRRLGLVESGEPETLREIGEDLNLCRKRVRQLERDGLIRLRRSTRVRQAFGREVCA